jgi:hypothetical protein
MNAFVKHASMVSALALMTIGTAGLAGAQTKSYGEAQMQPKGDQSDFCAANPNKCGPEMNKGNEEQGYTKKRRYQQEEDQATGDQQPDQPKMKQAQGDWKYDPGKHQRRRHKDDTFRFYFGGFWYQQPYWQVYGLVGGRIGCAEGRSIVRERGFYRVRTVECEGRAYTYIGRRHGDTFQVLVSARSGRIIDINPI